MTINRRVYVSMPADSWLEPNENDFKWGVVERIEALGYVPEIFFDPTGRDSLAADKAWTANSAQEVAQHCQGAVIIGLPRWQFRDSERDVFLSTEYSQYEGALLHSLGIPLQVLVQERVLRRGVFDNAWGPFITPFPNNVDRKWLNTENYKSAERRWHRQLNNRKDIFLGYCSEATTIAEQIRSFLEISLEATVLDWQRDFRPGRSILEEIIDACSRTSLGIFLFTKSDELATPAPGRVAAPRDNVVFEAGYFVSAKGKSKALIVREEGAKMPADLGGDIYAFFEKRSDLSGVKTAIERFVNAL